MIADFLRPVLAFLAPAFWTKNTSSVSLDLESKLEAIFPRLGLISVLDTYHTTASWNRGSFGECAILVRVGASPMIFRNSLSYIWKGRWARLSPVDPGGTNSYALVSKRQDWRPQMRTAYTLCIEFGWGLGRFQDIEGFLVNQLRLSRNFARADWR